MFISLSPMKKELDYLAFLFLGLGVAGCNILPFDTPAERYHKLRQVSYCFMTVVYLSPTNSSCKAKSIPIADIKKIFIS